MEFPHFLGMQYQRDVLHIRDRENPGNLQAFPGLQCSVEGCNVGLLKAYEGWKVKTLLWKKGIDFPENFTPSTLAMNL